MAKSLEDLQPIDLQTSEPTRALSTKATPEEQAIEQAGLEIKYQEELRRHLDRKDAFTEGLNKASALIFTSYFIKTTWSRIEEHPEFATLIKNGPIYLLEVIKTLMNDSVRAQYPLVSMNNDLSNVVNAKQIENKNLLDYMESFKQLCDVTKNQPGREFLHKLVEMQSDYRELTDPQAQ